MCVHSKSKIKTKVTDKQNVEHFKMINGRLYFPKFCNDLKMLLSSSREIFIRALLFSQPASDVPETSLEGPLKVLMSGTSRKPSWNS